MYSNLLKFRRVTPSFECNSLPSITVVSEPLDIQTMLLRAQNGILDLNSYQREMYSDNASDNDVDNDYGVMDRAFGASREDAIEELNRHNKVVNSELERIRSSKERLSPTMSEGDLVNSERNDANERSEDKE